MAITRITRSGITPDSAPKKTRSVVDASGLPGNIQNLSSSTVVGLNSQINLSWDAPEFTGDSEISGYTVSISPADGSASIVGTSASVTGLNPNTSYEFSVTPENSIGKGKGNSESRTTTNWNEATGGNTVVNVSNYNGSGETWRVHQFTSTGNFVISNSPNDFRYLVVGGGGSGGQNSPLGATNNGGRGGNVVTSSAPFSPGTYAVTSIGGGGNGGGGGGNTTWSTFSAPGGAGAVGCGSSGATSDITGTSVSYGTCGGGNDPGDGGSAGLGWGYYPGGKAGRVVISYRVG